MPFSFFQPRKLNMHKMRAKRQRLAAAPKCGNISTKLADAIKQFDLKRIKEELGIKRKSE